MGRISRWLIGPPESDYIQAAPSPRLTPSVALPPNGWGVGIRRLAPASMDFAPPYGAWTREVALTIPALSRARDLLVACVSSLPLTLWRLTSADDPTTPPVEQQIPPAAWMIRPDPFKTRAHLLAWTADDLIFLGRAYWLVTTRYATNFPATFVRMPAEEVSVHQDGTIKWGHGEVNPANVVEFLYVNDGVLWLGSPTIETCLRLEQAAQRFASNNVPSGWLRQTSGEPMGSDDLVALAAGWDAQRSINATGALNTDVEYHESTYDPERLQLVQAREHQALEVARLMNIPAYLLGAPVGTGMTYANTVQAKSDLIDFGAMSLINTIEQTLSGDNVLPRGQFCRLDLNVYLRSPLTKGDVSPNDAEIALNPPEDQTRPAADVANGRPRQLDGKNESQRGAA